MPRKICVVTGSRAEFGLLRWLMADIADDPALRLQVVVTGSHLAVEFGNTVEEVARAGFQVDEALEMLLLSDSAVGVTKSLGLGTIGFADVLRRLCPDILVLLGDRFEILAAAQAALIANIPVAHIHGGERTEGAIDEAIRHAVTKMSHLHFVATEDYRRRVIQLGESPERVFLTGAPGLDSLSRQPRLSKSELEARLGHTLDGPLVVATYHPVTLADQGSEKSLEVLLRALDGVGGLRMVFTGVNADPGYRTIGDRIKRFVAVDPGRRSFHRSLGHEAYLSLLALCDLCIGNSSSGLIEAPALGAPTVDIGPRQRGRIHGPTVIHVEEDPTQLGAAIGRAMSPGFQAGWPAERSPYGGPGASTRIRDVLRTVEVEGILMKEFHDLGRLSDREILTASHSVGGPLE